MKPKPLWEAERDHVKAVLEFFGGNVTRTAGILDFSCWPLRCGYFEVNCDVDLARQLALGV